MVNLFKSKLDVILKVIETLLVRINYIQGFVVRFNDDQEVGTFQQSCIKYNLLRISIQRFNDALKSREEFIYLTSQYSKIQRTKD